MYQLGCQGKGSGAVTEESKKEGREGVDAILVAAFPFASKIIPRFVDGKETKRNAGAVDALLV